MSEVIKEDSAKKLTWIRNRLKRKYKIEPAQTQEVLDAISDLVWDWRNSKYDLYGLTLEDVLFELGTARTPRNYK